MKDDVLFCLFEASSVMFRVSPVDEKRDKGLFRHGLLVCDPQDFLHMTIYPHFFDHPADQFSWLERELSVVGAA